LYISEFEKLELDTHITQKSLAELAFQDMIRKSKGVSFASHLTNMVRSPESPTGEDVRQEKMNRHCQLYNIPEQPVSNNIFERHTVGMSNAEELNYFEVPLTIQQQDRGEFTRSMLDPQLSNMQQGTVFPASQTNNGSMLGRVIPAHVLVGPPPGFAQLNTPMRPVFNYSGPVMSTSASSELNRGSMLYQESEEPQHGKQEEPTHAQEPQVPMPTTLTQMTADSQFLMNAYAKKSGLPIPLPQPTAAPVMYGMQQELYNRAMFQQFIPNNSVVPGQYHGSYGAPHFNLAYGNPQAVTSMPQTTTQPVTYHPYASPLSSFDQTLPVSNDAYSHPPSQVFSSLHSTASAQGNPKNAMPSNSFTPVLPMSLPEALTQSPIQPAGDLKQLNFRQ